MAAKLWNVLPASMSYISTFPLFKRLYPFYTAIFVISPIFLPVHFLLFFHNLFCKIFFCCISAQFTLFVTRSLLIDLNQFFSKMVLTNLFSNFCCSFFTTYLLIPPHFFVAIFSTFFLRKTNCVALCFSARHPHTGGLTTFLFNFATLRWKFTRKTR